MNSQNHENQCALLVLNRLTGGDSGISRMLKEGCLPAEMLLKIREENLLGFQQSLTELEKSFYPEQEMEKCALSGISCLSLLDREYPAALKEIHDPPIVLYVRGSLLPSDDAAGLAVVGSRHATSYGLYHARKFAREMSENGFTIISGLARGIDQAAHEGALEFPSGRTVAVLGSGADEIYPPESRKLYSRIVERGAVISEYALGAKPLAHHFPRRNRIISGLSLGVLVVEAHVRSGSLITARQALEQGRDVFAMPGRIDQLTSQGTHELLREGACLTDASWIMLEALGSEAQRRLQLFSAQKAAFDLSLEGASELPGRPCRGLPEEETIGGDPENHRLLALLGPQGLTCEELQERMRIPASDFFSLLLKLEMTRRLRKNPDGRYVLNVR